MFPVCIAIDNKILFIIQQKKSYHDVLFSPGAASKISVADLLPISDVGVSVTNESVLGVKENACSKF